MEKISMRQVLGAATPEERNQLYGKYVKQVTPTFSWPLNVCKAFLVGGLICALGQILINIFIAGGASKENAPLYAMLVLIGLSVLTTGLGWYARIAPFAGAGTVVPITGFANSVASSAIEFVPEGQVFGIGSSIFKIAGPVILYGVFASWTLGVFYWIGKLIGWW